ncbi:MAG: hypothetical protein DRN08_03550, partial [Thermoplasmata archaeon]
ILMSTSAAISITTANNNNDEIPREISVTYLFDEPTISSIQIHNTVYDRIFMKNAPCIGNPGEPSLPAKGAYILLPPNCRVIDIKIHTRNRIYLGSGFRITPVGDPIPLAINGFPILKHGMNREYNHNNDNETIPGKLFDKIGIYSFRGYDILVLTLYPMEYNTSTGELFYFKEMKVSVEVVRDDTHTNSLFRGLEKDRSEIIKMIDNPEVVSMYPKNITGGKNNTFSSHYDLLIITTDQFKDDFEPLKEAHNNKGVKTIIKTLSDINNNRGDVTPGEIRTFIRNIYLENGIEYVLIGGDEDVIPAQELYVRAWIGGETTYMPSDIYYACLDGTYNYDGDDKWGEPNDGPGGGDVDLIAEVYVGRACVGNSNEVNNFVDKTIAYMENNESRSSTYNDRVLLVGELLWSDPPTWGGDYMDELINGSNANGYTTVGIPSSDYNITTLYDRDWPGNNWPTSEIIGHINNGLYIINHLGHSWYDYNMKMTNNDVLSYLTNDQYCFIYSQGCMAGGFDNPYGYDCIAEYFTVKTDHGAFAVVMNARYGWGVTGGTDGASHRFNREFWDAVFGEKIFSIGKANQDSKEDNLYRINQACMRWCYYETNLLGDPAVTFYNEDINNPPEKPDRPTGKKRGRVGESYTFTTVTIDPDGDQIYYKWSWGDGNMSNWLGPYNSGETVNVSYSWSKKGRYEVKVKSRDIHKAESEWSDPLVVNMPVDKVFFRQWLSALFNLLKTLFPNLFSIF